MDSPGERIRRRRKQLKLTQKAVAQMVGVSSPSVTQWENDDQLPKKDNADKLCMALQTNWDWIKHGTGSPDSTTVTPVQFEANQPVPLLTKSQILEFLTTGFLSGALKDAGPKSHMIRSSVNASDKTFAYCESSEGMMPRIEPGDMIYIDPEQNHPTPGREIFMIRTDNGFVLGSIKDTPRGLMMYFDNQSPGWEPMPVTAEDCVGRVVAFVPSWLK